MRSKRDDFVSLKGIDYIELYVGNAGQAAHFYRTMLKRQMYGRANLDLLKARVLHKG